jgi:DNA-binding NarL/FixJ family response regulator
VPGPMKVVCVDDDPYVLELLTATAEQEGDFVVVAAVGDAPAAFDALRTHRPDVFIVDHGLVDGGPVVDLREGGRGNRGLLGLELLEVARELVPSATIVLFTGWPGLDTAASRAGVDVLVEKPRISEIWPAVREARAARSA